MRTFSEYFDQDSQDLKDLNKTNHVHRAHKAKPDPVVVAKWVLAVFVLIVLAQFSPWVQDAQAKNRAQSIAREGVR